MNGQHLINLLFKHSLLVEAIGGGLDFPPDTVARIWREEREVYEEICKIQNNLIDKENGLK